MVDVLTNLPFDKDAEIYRVVQFKWIESTDTFHVILNVLDKDKYHSDASLLLVPYKNIEIHLQNNPGEPHEEYRTPSALYYVDENGIHFATRNMRKFLGIPGNARMCYQCEYDEYIWKKVESGELPKTQSRFYNWAVWNAYREYRLHELQESIPLIINCEEEDTNDKESISSVTDDSETSSVCSLEKTTCIEEYHRQSFTDSDDDDDDAEIS